MDVAIMIEGQNGLNWARWKRISAAVDASGYAGLFRSDHYTNANPPDLDSLECWTSLTWLATNSTRLVFGPLVSPLSFRHPTMLARMAVALDELSEGRFILGVGAGWQQREHTKYGLELLEPKDRFTRFEEGVDVISMLLHSDVPVEFTGKYYNLHEAILLPRPLIPGRPPLCIGGKGKTRTLPLVARFADEWNATFPTLSEFRRLNPFLNGLIKDRGRQTADVRRSVVAGCVYGVDREDVERKVSDRTKGQRTIADLQERGMIVGTADEIVEQCRAFANAGAQRIMLQWLDLDDIQGLESMAVGIIDKLSSIS